MFDAITKCWCSGAEQLKQMVNHENIVADETQANHNTGNSGLTFDSDSVTLRIVGRMFFDPDTYGSAHTNVCIFAYL